MSTMMVQRTDAPNEPYDGGGLVGGPHLPGEGSPFRQMRRQTLVLVATAEGDTAAIPLIDWDETSKALDSAGYVVLKRLIDIVGASIGLILLSPFMLIAMLLVWLEDRGSTIFRQERVGLNGETFMIYKIRTMVQDAEARLAEVAAMNHHDDHRTFKAKDDPRLLKVGKLLRKYSIDEFPQLLNVLSGEMSLVGPRPPVPREVDLYDASDYIRLAVKPGLTCYWQISGRSTIPFKQQVQLDRRYIRESSTRVDLAIMAKTVPAMLFGTGH